GPPPDLGRRGSGALADLARAAKSSSKGPGWAPVRDRRERGRRPLSVPRSFPMTESPDSSPEMEVFLFLRDPAAGAVKTRLAAGCGAEAARNLYILMAEMLARDLAPQPGDPHHLRLYVSPAESTALSHEWLFPGGAPGVSGIPQPDTSL